METRSQAPSSVSLLVDSHVHFHELFERDAFLDAALANFQKGAAELGLDHPFLGCLLLTEAAGDHWFRRLRDRAGGGSGGRWTFERTAEPGSLMARHPDGERLLLTAGRQIRTREGLEVLALVSSDQFPDGLPLGDTLTRVRWSGAVSVIPWGFGKWWFYRGGLVEAVLRRPQWRGIFLGDNAGRLSMVGRPWLFRQAAARGVPVLPGSDPLPLAEHAGRAGSYGFLLQVEMEEGRPAESLRRRLRSLGVQPRTFGRCSSPLEFARAQTALRVSRRAQPAATAGRSTAASQWTP